MRLFQLGIAAIRCQLPIYGLRVKMNIVHSTKVEMRSSFIILIGCYTSLYVCYSSAGIDVFSVALGLFLIFIVFGVVSSGNLASLFTRCE